jgi:hypothetical protein
MDKIERGAMMELHADMACRFSLYPVDILQKVRNESTSLNILPWKHLSNGHFVLDRRWNPDPIRKTWCSWLENGCL